MFPNGDQVLSLIRSVMLIAGTWLGTKGVSSTDVASLQSNVVTIVGALLALMPVVWGMFAHTHTAMIESVNAADNGVKVVAETEQGIRVNHAL